MEMLDMEIAQTTIAVEWFCRHLITYVFLKNLWVDTNQYRVVYLYMFEINAKRGTICKSLTWLFRYLNVYNSMF